MYLLLQLPLAITSSKSRFLFVQLFVLTADRKLPGEALILASLNKFRIHPDITTREASLTLFLVVMNRRVVLLERLALLNSIKVFIQKITSKRVEVFL